MGAQRPGSESPLGDSSLGVSPDLLLPTSWEIQVSTPKTLLGGSDELSAGFWIALISLPTLDDG